MSQIQARYNIVVHTILELVKFLSAFLSLLYIVYAIIFRTVYFLLPTNPDIDRNSFEMSDMKFNLVFIFIVLGISWFISYRQKKLSVINPFKLDKEELLALFITSLLLAYFFTRSFSILSSANNNITTGVFTVFFLFFLTQIIEFYNYYYPELHINTFKQYLSNIFNKQNFTFLRSNNLSSSLPFVTIVIVLGGYSVFSSLMVLHKSKQYQNVLKESLFIVRVAPPKTTLAYNVQLQGYNFGKVPDQRYKLFSTYGQVEIRSWTDSAIDFVVPLSWKVGDVELWIERPGMRDEKTMIGSNVVKLAVLDRWDFFPKQNESIFVKASKKLLRVTYLDFWNNYVSRVTF